MNILEFVEDPHTILRKQRIEETVAKYPDVKIIQEIAGLTSQEEATDKISNTISSLGDKLNGMIATGYVPTVATSLILTDLKNTNISFVGIDTDQAVLDAIKNGNVTGTFGQNSYFHGYRAALYLKYLADGFVPKEDYVFINSGGPIVSKDNLDTFNDMLWDDIQKAADKMADYFQPKQ